MTKNLNQRLRSLKEVGGTKTLRVLPRNIRAQAIASIMLEEPANSRAAKAAAMFAFKSAVEKSEPFRAKKIADKFSLPMKECVMLVSAKAELLRAENESSTDAADFELIFELSPDAKKRFVESKVRELEIGKEKLEHHYPLADVYFKQIIKDQQERGIDVNIDEAATWLAVSFIRKRFLEEALNVVGQYLIKDGRVHGPQKILLEDELKKILPICSDKYLEKIAMLSKKQGTYSLMRNAIVGMGRMDSSEPEEVEVVFRLSRIFSIKYLMSDCAAYLTKAYLDRAEAQPENSMEDFLLAARTAIFAGLDEKMDEAVIKYLSLCESLGSGKPEFMEKAMHVALEFSRADSVQEFGEKAAPLYLAQGELEKAEQMANESRNSVLRYQISRIRERSAL
jgi:hypothetical protein